MTDPGQRVMDKVAPLFPAGGFSALVYNWLHYNDYPGLKTDSDFINISGVDKGKSGILYLDPYHYTGKFARIIAEEIFNKLALQGVIR